MLGNPPWKLSSGAALLYAVRVFPVAHLSFMFQFCVCEYVCCVTNAKQMVWIFLVPQDVAELNASAKTRAAAQAAQGAADTTAVAPRYQERGIKILTMAEQKAAKAAQRAEAEKEA